MLFIMNRKTDKFCNFEDLHGEPNEGSDSLSGKLGRPTT